MIFYIYFRTEQVRIFVIISLILNAFSYGKAQIPHRFFVATDKHYLKDVPMHAVFFLTNSSKDRMSLLEIVWIKKNHFNIHLLLTKTRYMHFTA